MKFIDLFDAARELQDFCDSQGWRSCFIGGIAALRWSHARITRDIDLTLLTGFGHEAPFIEALLARYHPRVLTRRSSVTGAPRCLRAAEKPAKS
jgi:hypothetical protein